MLKKERLNQLSKNLSTNGDNYMESFRQNLHMYLNESDITIKSLSECADVPFSTLNNILYSDVLDCKTSTVVKLAKALNITVDELLGCGTLSEKERKAISSARNLPEYYKYLITWFINRQVDLQRNTFKENEKSIPVMTLKADEDGTLHTTHTFKTVNISTVSIRIRPQIFMGIEMAYDYYMPDYSPYDILLIANDRKPKQSENSVIIYGNNLFLAHRKEVAENGTLIGKYYSIRDGKYRVDENDVDDVIGYIAGVYHEENSED